MPQNLHTWYCRPFAVNLPLQYPAIKEHVKIVIDKKVPIVFTSAGNPKLFTPALKKAGITVVHVVGSSAFALKAQNAGVDAVVAEGKLACRGWNDELLPSFSIGGHFLRLSCMDCRMPPSTGFEAGGHNSRSVSCRFRGACSGALAGIPCQSLFQSCSSLMDCHWSPSDG